MTNIEAASSQAPTSPHRRARRMGVAPFLKWVGGKGRLLPALLPLLPQGVRRMRFLEPFLGGGAMFFGLTPRRALLSDINGELVATYLAVRDRVEEVIAHLAALAAAHDEGAYYEARERYNHGAHTSEAERAAVFIYLNKTCFNGLHRVNRRGQFNVPLGRHARPAITNPKGLRAASRALRRAEVRCVSFEALLEQAEPGDFVYLDPPYVPSSRTSSFTEYAQDGFDARAQSRLRDVFGELDRRGAKLMLSNSAVAAVRDLYRGYQIDEVWAPRTVNSKAEARGAVCELVIRNYRGGGLTPRRWAQLEML